MERQRKIKMVVAVVAIAVFFVLWWIWSRELEITRSFELELPDDYEVVRETEEEIWITSPGTSVFIIVTPYRIKRWTTRDGYKEMTFPRRPLFSKVRSFSFSSEEEEVKIYYQRDYMDSIIFATLLPLMFALVGALVIILGDLQKPKKGGR